MFGSWKNERAIIYRQRYAIPSEWGTAVNVQAMVFGNLGDDSATGVAFTRDPANGEKVIYGEYLVNAQGEDVVAGVRTPKQIAEMAQEMPESYQELQRVRAKLEQHFRDMQDLEFTIENRRLFILQTRNGKRTGVAAIRIAVEMNAEKLMDQRTALLKIPAESIDSLLVPVFDARAQKAARVIGHGLPAGPGAASGLIVFTAAAAEQESKRGNRVVLCRMETSPDDLKGMLFSQGILTSRGGVSSHAALVARQLGKVCICGATNIAINYEKKTLTADGVVLKEGDYISIDGSTGEIYAGPIDSADSEVKRVLNGSMKPAQSYTYRLFATVMTWADKYRRLTIRTNADTPAMAQQAVAYGAEGIGLCRTEHMFFDGDRIDYMRQMILAADEVQRRVALKMLLPFQKKDFAGLFKAMDGRPVTIRLLDPPLHEFLPQDDAIRRKLATHLGVPLEFIIDRIRALHEENPMLGCRGCRLGILYPEITEMQSRAIFEAAAQVMNGKNPVVVKPEIMIPLVGFKAELADQITIVHRVAREVIDAHRGQNRLPRRHDDRGAARGDHRRRTRRGRRVLQLRHQRPDADDAGAQPRRHGLVLRDVSAQRNLRPQSVCEHRRTRCRSADHHRGRARSFDAANIKLGICGEHAGDPGVDRSSAIAPGSTTSAVRRRACRSRVWRRRKQRCATPEARRDGGHHLHRRSARARAAPRAAHVLRLRRRGFVDRVDVPRERVGPRVDQVAATRRGEHGPAHARDADDRRERIDAGGARADGSHRYAARGR